MRRKIASWIMLSLLLLSMLTLAFDIQTVEAWSRETIYIRSDGSVDPGDAPLSPNINNTEYTLTDNVIWAPGSVDAIVVERDNIVLNGAGWTLQGPGSPYDWSRGINLTRVSGVTIKDLKIKAFTWGVYLNDSDGNIISGNNITDQNVCGIVLENGSQSNNITGNTIETCWNASIYVEGSHLNRISRNNITGNGDGVLLQYSMFNTIYGNKLTNNLDGVQICDSGNNTFYHNNFINNTRQVTSYFSLNFWNISYPSGGNYWSNYNGTDLHSGPNQNEISSDGLGDTPHVIDEDNLDGYPLMNSYQPVGFNATKNGEDYPVTVLSNSTITNFNFSYPSQRLSFNATGSSSTIGYCNIILPKDLINDTIVVIVNGNPVAYNMEENATHFFIYFAYSHSTSFIEILATILGDINGDRIVNIQDIVLCALAFGSKSGDSNWNPVVDLNQDEIINIIDLVIIGVKFGETY